MGNMLLISDVTKIREEVKFMLDFICEILIPLHPFYVQAEYYNHIITLSPNRGERHQKMWNERAKVALIEPLTAVITARIKENDALYHNLKTYNSARKERVTDIAAAVNSVLHHAIDLEDLMSSVIFWQDKKNTPQGLTHDFAMTKFSQVKQLDKKFERILDTLFEGEENVKMIEYLMEGTSVPPIEWKPVGSIDMAFDDKVRSEQWGMIRELPPPNEFPELVPHKKLYKDQDKEFVNEFFRQVDILNNVGILSKKRDAAEVIAGPSSKKAKY